MKNKKGLLTPIRKLRSYGISEERRTWLCSCSGFLSHCGPYLNDPKRLCGRTALVLTSLLEIDPQISEHTDCAHEDTTVGSTPSDGHFLSRWRTERITSSGKFGIGLSSSIFRLSAKLILIVGDSSS